MLDGEFRQGELWGHGPGPQDALRWVFHVDMDAFFASVEQLDNPALAGVPVIVANSPMTVERLREVAAELRRLPKMPEFIKGVRGVVASASYEARAFGVRSAMPLARALALCPNATVLPGHFSRYRQVAEKLRAIWADFSPLVETVSLDEAYLDMTGAELSGGPIQEIGARMKKRIREEVGLTASVGIASNKLVAKVASDLQKPDGLVFVARGDEASTLAPLPVRALQGVGKRTETVLTGLGIHTVGQLAKATRSVLVFHLGGDNASHLINYANGIDYGRVEPPGDPKSISRETTMTDDTSDLVTLKKLLVNLSDHVAWSLRNEGMCARVINIKLRLLPARRRSRNEAGEDTGYGRLITRQVTLAVPTDSARLIEETACHLLDVTHRSTGMRNNSEVVRLIGVVTSNLVHTEDLVGQFRSSKILKEESSSLPEKQEADENEDSNKEKERRLTTSIDDIRKRFGYDAIASATSAGIKKSDGNGVVDG
ncbi:MAG: DNA polymerase IV [Chloroflexia bacterium]